MKKNIKLLIVAVVAIVMVFGLTATAFAAPYTWSGNNPQISVSQNNRHLNVRLAQVIASHSARRDIVIDGVYGSDSASCVTKFQQWYGLSQDGIVGSATWQSMQEKLIGHGERTEGAYRTWYQQPGYVRQDNTWYAVRRLASENYVWKANTAAPDQNWVAASN